MIFLRPALILLLAVFTAQQAHAAAAGSGQSGLCSYTPATIPLSGSECWPLNQNGVTKTITATQFFKNAVQGPGSSTVGNAAVWSNTAGTALADPGAPPALLLADTAALQSLPILNALTSPGAVARVATYLKSRGTVSQSTPVDYYLDNLPCTPDGGSCFAASVGGYFWHITPQAIWNPQWWGAYGDVTIVRTAIMSVTAGNCAVTIPGGPGFVSTDVGKYITISNGSQTTTPGASYQGTIAAFTDATHITVSQPCPLFNVIPSASLPATQFFQYAYYGHDDSAAWNSAIGYARNLFMRASASGQPQIDGGGLSYGVVADQVLVNGNIAINNSFFAGLSSANLPIKTKAVFDVAAPFATWNQVIVDAGYLPINACRFNGNGTIFGYGMRCLNWQGSGQAFTFTASSLIAANFTGHIDTCNATKPFTCTLHINPINSNGVISGTLTAGSGYSAGDEVVLSQTGGAPVQPIAVRVNTVNGSGGVTGIDINEGGVYTTNPTSFSQTSVTHNDGSAGIGTGFAITAPAYGPNTIQPGMSVVSDSGSGAQVPAGTYIISDGGIGDPPAGGGTGGNGAYTVMNLTTDPTIGSVTMDTLGFGLRVAACEKDLWTTSGTIPGVGLVSHGNESAGIYDRTFTVGCPNSRTLVLSRAPSTSFAAQNLTFNIDANGMYLTDITGIQNYNSTISQGEGTWLLNVHSHYGCSVLTNAPGGTNFTGGTIGYGAANVCFGPRGVNNQFRHEVTVGVSRNVNNPNEPPAWNPPAFLLMDGANNNYIIDTAIGGAVQVFSLVSAPTNCSNCQLMLEANQIFNVFGDGEFAPNNVYQLYTEQPASSTAALSKSNNTENNNFFANPYDIAFMTGGGASQSWQSFTALQIAVMAQSMSVNLANYNGQQAPLFGGPGIDLGTSAIQRAGFPPVNKTASFILADTDTNNGFDLTGTGTINVTIPNTLSQDSVLGLNNSAFQADIFNRTSGGGSAAVNFGAGVTLYSGGTSQASPFALSANTWYQIKCPRNTNGTTVFCFIK